MRWQLLVRPLILAVAMITSAPLARGHFLWLSSTADETAERWATAWFSEEPAPGEARLLGRIEGLEGWFRVPGAEPTPLSFAPAPGSEPVELRATFPREKSWVIEAHRQYGVFRRGEAPPILLEYYAKHLGAAAPENWAELAASKQLALDLSPVWKGDELTLTVRWQGTPVADAEVALLLPDGSESTLKTNTEGQASLSAPSSGTYAARTRYVEGERSGELVGQAYTAVWHVSTATFAHPLSKASAPEGTEPTAADLLAGARAHRALWDNFPGFTSKLTVQIDQAEVEGRLEVSSAGETKIELPECPHGDWIREQLESLVSHRMPESPFTEAAEFDAEPGHHALGRLLRLEDAGMGSKYRVKANTITEVNRSAGPLRFTISVLNVEWNPEGKYLPGVFTASFWNQKSGALEMSQTFVHHWKRVDRFDLPARLQIVHSGRDERRVLDIEFDNPQLKTAPETGPAR